MGQKEGEYLDERIAAVLSKVCPAFHRDKHGGPATWHQCKCKAETRGNCTCVWQEVSDCEAGKWPQLAFVDEHRAAEQAKAKIELERAKQALAEAGGKE